MDRLALGAALSLAACHAEPVLIADPPTGPMSGYYAVTFDLHDAGLASGVTGVTVGGVHTYDLIEDGETVTVMVQGLPSSGPAEVVLHTADGDVGFPDAFAYDPPVDPLFDRFMAMGASLTQGTQGGVPTHHANLASPPHVLATQTGAYMGLPLLKRDLFPFIGPEDIGPAPDCTPPDVVDFIAQAAVDVIGELNDEQEDRIGFYLGRVDPDLQPSDVAAGGSNLADLVHGTADSFEKQFITKLVYAPYADIMDEVHTSQLSLVEDADPTLVISTDMYGNDLIGGVLLSQFVDPDQATPVDEIEANMILLVDRLEATGAEVFLANMPRPTLLPATDDKRVAALAFAREQALAEGADPDAAEAEEAVAVDARIATLDAAGAAYNAILDELASTRPTIHVVDFAAEVQRIEDDGLQIGAETVSVRKFGGLLSTDGVHFSDTGYAMVANLFIDTINAELGLDLAPIDLAPILADDPYSPAALIAGGLDIPSCEGT